MANLNDMALLQKNFRDSCVLFDNISNVKKTTRSQLNEKAEDERKRISNIFDSLNAAKLNYLFKVRQGAPDYVFPKDSILPIIFLSLPMKDYSSKKYDIHHQKTDVKNEEQPVTLLKKLNSSYLRLLPPSDKEFLLNLYDEFAHRFLKQIEKQQEIREFIYDEEINQLTDPSTINRSHNLMKKLIYGVFSDLQATTLSSIFEPNTENEFFFSEEISNAYHEELDKKATELRKKIFIDPYTYIKDDLDRYQSECDAQQIDFDRNYDIICEKLHFKYSKREIVFQLNTFLTQKTSDNTLDLIHLSENIYYHLNYCMNYFAYPSPNFSNVINSLDRFYGNSEDCTRHPFHTYNYLYTLVNNFLKEVFLAPRDPSDIGPTETISDTEPIEKSALITLLSNLKENNQLVDSTNTSVSIMNWTDIQEDAENLEFPYIPPLL